LMDSLLSSLDKVLMIIIIGSFAYGLLGDIRSIEQVVLYQNISYIIAIFIVTIVLLNTIKSLRISFDWTASLNILKQGLPYALLIMLTAVCNKVDVVMLDFLRDDGAYQSGIYAAGYRFLDAANMFGYLFGALLLPMYSNSFSNKIPLDELFNTSLQVLLIISIPLTLITSFYGKEIFQMFYTEEYVQHFHILIMLMLSLVPILVSHSVGPLLIGAGKLRWLNGIFCVAIIMNIVLNYFIIPRFGALGSAVTTLITEVALIASCFWVVVKICEVQINKVGILKICILLIISFFTLSILSRWALMDWMFQVVTFLLLYLMVILILKFKMLKEMYSLIEKR
ncbi:MAG TPA: polysaccharide biosynthesis C-terminal domain-containing protein, partial [Saprospiraceae bacterium]|nr:polysaccharide biosynthesis C-terminal domain-containing protein [Saprospiraceae bacterium]